MPESLTVSKLTHPLPRRLWTLARRHWLLLAVSALLVVNFFSFNPIYTHYFLHVGKPVHTGQVPADTGPGEFSIDKFELANVDGQETYNLRGWAFLRQPTRPLSEYHKQVVLIDVHNQGYFFAADDRFRPDVTQYFKDLAIDLDRAGYQAYISKYVLPKGSYNIAFYFIGANDSEAFLFRTNFYLVRTSNTLELSMH